MIQSPLFIACVLSFVWALLIALFAIPSIIYVAHEKNLLDMPNQRTIHKHLTPRMGGLAIFAGFISALTIFGDFTSDSIGLQQLMAGSVVIFFIGLKDDIADVSAFKKFFVQLLATSIVVFMGDIRIKSLYGFLGVSQIEPGISYILSFFVIIGVTNAVNLIDGLDGLAGSITVIICAVFGVYFFQFNSTFATLAFCLAGAVLGFLRFNFYKATIFMGDTGSLVCGFLISVMAIKFIELAPQNDVSPVISIAIVIIPVIDTLRVFILRIFNGISPFAPDKNHIHHRCMDMGLSQMTTVLTLCLLNLVFIGVTILMSRYLGISMVVLLLVIISLTMSLILELATRKVAR